MINEGNVVRFSAFDRYAIHPQSTQSLLVSLVILEPKTLKQAIAVKIRAFIAKRVIFVFIIKTSILKIKFLVEFLKLIFSKLALEEIQMPHLLVMASGTVMMEPMKTLTYVNPITSSQRKPKSAAMKPSVISQSRFLQ